SQAVARAELLRRLCRLTAEFLQRPEPAVDPRQGFVALGFDSLRAVDFRGRLEGLLGCELRSTLLFDQPDCERLCDYLLALLRGSHGAAAGAPAAAGPTAAGAASAIAIVGMACRFPGDAVDLDAFWQLLREGRSAIGEVPAGRWPVDELFDPDPAAPGRI